MINLEPLCAEYGHRMIMEDAGGLKNSDKENVVTRALGVLSENGIYAMCLYLLSCRHKDYGRQILMSHLKEFWQQEQVALLPAHGGNNTDFLEEVRTIAESLPKLILAKKITEQTLTFARYHAKAGSEAGKREDDHA